MGDGLTGRLARGLLALLDNAEPDTFSQAWAEAEAAANERGWGLHLMQFNSYPGHAYEAFAEGGIVDGEKRFAQEFADSPVVALRKLTAWLHSDSSGG